MRKHYFTFSLCCLFDFYWLQTYLIGPVEEVNAFADEKEEVLSQMAKNWRQIRQKSVLKKLGKYSRRKRKA